MGATIKIDSERVEIEDWFTTPLGMEQLGSPLNDDTEVFLKGVQDDD